jgi:2-oxoglutarate dehydrogenase E2 component (dihydrolipoamide succinyltransferase)
MQIEIRVPPMGESITEATVSNWLKAPGEAVSEGEVLVELETDKVMVEVPAIQNGVLAEVLKPTGETVHLGDLLGRIDTDGKVAAASAKPAPAAAPKAAPRVEAKTEVPPAAAARNEAVGPAVRRMADEHQLDLSRIPGSGRRGQVTKEDVVRHMDPGAVSPAASAPATAPPRPAAPPAAPHGAGEREERVKMSRLRLRIAERLLQAQQTAAILTTFNEVDMSALMELRARYKERFKEKHGLAVGFMSFFTKACIEALRAFPAVNAEIAGDEIVYKHHYDIGVAVGTERGLVVPVVRDADHKRFIEIELEIADLAKRAREGKLSLDDLSGGTFTISNGGIYGSMLSTPILNPPQSGILGMHNIVKRAVVVDDQVVVRPMMYLALSYDHRIIDGREAVQFLVRVKECVEDPARILLEI